MEVQGIRCPQCGTELAPGTTQCWKCGCYFGQQQPNPVRQQQQVKESRAWAIAAFVMGIVGMLLSCTVGGAWLCACAVILAIVSCALKEPAGGFRKTALVCGIIGLFIFVAVAISGIDDSGTNSSNSTTTTSESQAESESSVKNNSSSESENVKTSESEKESESESEDIPLLSEEIEIYNDNGVSIVVTDIEESKSEYIVNMTITNNSEKDYDIAAHSYAVNGFMAGENLYGFGSVSVAAGKKAKLEADIDRDWMEENGMNELQTVSILFWAYYDDMKEWDSGLVTLETNLYSDSHYAPSGEQIYSDDYVTVWLVGTEDNTATLIIGNNTSRNAEYTFDNCSVNEWSYEITNYSYDYYDEQLLAGTYAIVEFEIDNDFLFNNDIADIEEIEFTITLTDTYGSYSDWLNVTTDKIKIEF